MEAAQYLLRLSDRYAVSHPSLSALYGRKALVIAKAKGVHVAASVLDRQCKGCGAAVMPVTGSKHGTASKVRVVSTKGTLWGRKKKCNSALVITCGFCKHVEKRIGARHVPPAAVGVKRKVALPKKQQSSVKKQSVFKRR